MSEDLHLYQDLRLDLPVEPPPLTIDQYGMARVTGSRATLLEVMGAYYKGRRTAHQVAAAFLLDAGDVHSIIGFCLRHKEEVDAYLDEINRRTEERVRRAIADGMAPVDRQERLRQRKAQAQHRDLHLDLPVEPPPLTIDQYGMARVTGSRISLPVLMDAYHIGRLTADQIAADFLLDPGDVHSVIGFCRRHKEEVETYLDEINRRTEEGIRRAIADGITPLDWQDRLLRRKAEAEAAQDG